MGVAEDKRKHAKFNRELAKIIDLYWSGKLSAVRALDRIAGLPR